MGLPWINLISAALYLVLGFHFVSAAPGSATAANVYSVANVYSPPLTLAAVHRDLGPLLSHQASIYFPNSPGFTNLTARWSVYQAPNIAIVVEARTVDDVAAAVTYANKVKLPFLAVNRGHGTANTMAKFQHGISINLQALDSIEIATDGNSALLGGGVYTAQVIEYLWKYGKVTPSGVCGCTGFVGPALGAGFGWLEGLHGLVLDNLIDANVVLANGSQINVSVTSHPDLWWGLRGAGHNFGIVTSFRSKIYDSPPSGWYHTTLYFSGDKLAELFSRVNALTAGDLPKELTLLLEFIWQPQICPTEPVIMVTLVFGGPETQAAPYVALFSDIGPLSGRSSIVPYPELNHALQTGEFDPVCDHGSIHLQFNNILYKSYNIDAVKAVWALYQENTIENPALRYSINVFEVYSQQGVDAVTLNSTAYAHRGSSVQSNLIISYLPTDSNLTTTAREWGEQSRKILQSGNTPGQPLRVYVNFAFGDLPLQAIYGYEPWRLNTLRTLKKKYDPLNRFGYFWSVSGVENDSSAVHQY